MAKNKNKNKQQQNDNEFSEELAGTNAEQTTQNTAKANKKPKNKY
ncbi:hypothetical protein [Paenibacillus agricola]|nr:hypothetical protein [Paenibacillus agricola]